jgi:hypothetical protein
MKSDTFIIKYDKQPQKGTFNMKETNCFFGSKMMEIEDEIVIDDKLIQYFNKLNGYQNYDNLVDEVPININLNDIKLSYHTISIIQQNQTDYLNNTRWQIDIKIREILKLYLFSKIKERRVFKSITEDDIYNKSLDTSIDDYINNNLIDRYEFNKINLYIKYENIEQDQTNNSGSKLQYNPSWNVFLKDKQYLITNLNIISDISNLNDLIINYNQIKPSTIYRFDYYYDLYFKKI